MSNKITEERYLNIYEEDYLDFYDPVKCIGDASEKWCTFQWRIYNLKLSTQDTVRSRVFTTRLLQNTYWCLEVKLTSPGNLRTVNISLHRLQSDEKAVSIVDVIYKFDCNDKTTVSDKKTLVYGDGTPITDKYSYDVKFHRSKLEFVTFECKLRPNKKMLQHVDHGKYDESLPVHLRKLLQSGELYDTIIEVGNWRLRAHYAILCSRLANILFPILEIVHGKHIVKMKHLPVSVVKEMLKYAYTGQACLDPDSASHYKDILMKYCPDFYRQCFYEDNPFATTSFNYETDSLEWYIGHCALKTFLGCGSVKVLRLDTTLELRLNMLETDEEKKGITLSFKHYGKQLPKPTVISCKCYLFSKESDETFDLGETEVFFNSKVTEAEVKLCSFLEVKRGISTFRPSVRSDVYMKTDFKFCYGSFKSAIENLYEGLFDISRCTGCGLLWAGMDKLYRFVDFKDITVEREKYHPLAWQKVRAHKAILLARWAEAEKYKVKTNRYVTIEEDVKDLDEYFRKIYTGVASK